VGLLMMMSGIGEEVRASHSAGEPL